MSKFSLEVLKRSVYPHINANDPDVILGPTIGEDIALTRVGNDILVSHLDPIIGAVNRIGYLAVHVACNDIATSGAPPRWLQILVIVPSQDDESLLREIMQDIQSAVNETNTTIIGGHTGYSNSLGRPLVSVTAMGTLGGNSAVLTRGAQIGDRILVTKGIALEGTAILATDFTTTAQKLGLSAEELEAGRAIMQNISVIPEALILSASGATAMHDVTRGGLLETLLEIAKLGSVGVEIETENIPIPPIVTRFSKAFQFDPLQMISSGTLVATIPPSQIDAAKKALDQEGIVYAEIGQVVEGDQVKVIQHGWVNEYQEMHPDKGELARMWVTYPTDIK